MAFKFRIYFSGLCVFVPDQLPAPTSFDVLLVNLLLPRQLRRPKPGEEQKPNPEREILDPHFPLMIFKDPGPPERTADFKPLLGDHVGRNVCLLLHDELEILPDGNSVSAAIDVSPPGEEPLTHIAAMKEIFPDRSRIDPALLTVDLKPGERVVSRIRGLSGGSLWTADLSKEDVKIEGEGAASATFQDRRIAIRVAWEIECHSHMILRWRRYDLDSQATVEIGDLRWDPMPGNAPISIWIENREIDTFIGVPPSYPVARALADFEVFFDLASSTAPPVGDPPPVPIAIPLTGPGTGPQVGSLHGGKCPPTLMLR